VKETTSNYEKTDHSHAGSRRGHAFEFVHDRCRKTGRTDDDHYVDDGEEKHGSKYFGGANHHSVLAPAYRNWEGTRFGESLFF
jgi:hypothetical protein